MFPGHGQLSFGRHEPHPPDGQPDRPVYLRGESSNAAHATGYRETWIRADGATALVAETRISVGAGADTLVSLVSLWLKGPGQYIEVTGSRNAGVALNAVVVRMFWIADVRG